jgi:hypothetical protein
MRRDDDGHYARSMPTTSTMREDRHVASAQRVARQAFRMRCRECAWVGACPPFVAVALLRQHRCCCAGNSSADACCSRSSTAHIVVTVGKHANASRTQARRRIRRRVTSLAWNLQETACARVAKTRLLGVPDQERHP